MTADLEFGPSGGHGIAPRPGGAGQPGQGGAAAEAEGAAGLSGRTGQVPQPVRTPAMRAYCATLARFTSSVQSTEQLLRNDDAGTREDTEQRELTATTRLRGIDRAASAAADGLDHCTSVRSAHGLPLRAPSWGEDDADVVGASEAGGAEPPGVERGGFGTSPDAVASESPARTDPGRRRGGTDGSAWPAAAAAGRPGGARGRAGDTRHAGPGAMAVSPAQGLERLRGSGGSADLGVALTSLGRRRDALRLAEDEFAGWLATRDEQTRRISLGAAVGAALAAAAVMAVAGIRMSAAVSLALLVVCTLAVVAVAVGVAASRRSPRVCRGDGLARRPHALGLARYGAQVGGLALLALAAANIGAGAL